jgi:catechol 2,3-dioxygenase-like lactoylglutathione lyase family enzyme
MNLNQIRQISVYAKDLDEAITFYRDKLGAKFLQKFDPHGSSSSISSGTRLLPRTKWFPKRLYTFTVDEHRRATRIFKTKGVDFLEGPHLIFRDDQGMFGDAGEEEWMAFFSDPSGNTLALATRKRS